MITFKTISILLLLFNVVTFLYVMNAFGNLHRRVYDVLLFQSTPVSLDCSSSSSFVDFIEALKTCTVDCGSDCPYCGQVYAYCLENGFLSSNYTQDACNIARLDNIPVSTGCPFQPIVSGCCKNTVPPAPPSRPSVDCSGESSSSETVYEALTYCQEECGPYCTICGQVYTYCKQVGYLGRAINYTVEACNILTLDSIPTSLGACPFNQTFDQCCEGQPFVPVSPPVVTPVSPPVTPPVTPPVEPPVTPPIAPPVTPPVSPPVTPTCASVATISCSSNIDCPKYFACSSVGGGGRCINIQGLSCDEGFTCASGNCTTAPSCLCSATTTNFCLDSSCATNTCGSFQCFPGGPPIGGCFPSLAPCTSSDDCGNPKPYCVNGFCHDYSCLEDACRDINLPYCNLAEPCPINSVCEDTQGSYCIGSVGGQCISDGDCNPAYSCQGCTCAYVAPDAIQAVLVPTCGISQPINCGSVFSFALQESITSPFGLSCPTSNMQVGDPVAFFDIVGTFPSQTVTLSFSTQFNTTGPIAGLFDNCVASVPSSCTDNVFLSQPNQSLSYLASENKRVVVYYPTSRFVNSLGAIVTVTVNCA